MNNNLTDDFFYKTPELIQPYVAAMGCVTSAGFQRTENMYMPNRMIVQRIAFATYRITHKLATLKYIVLITPETPLTYGVATTATDCTITFSNDTNFSFIIYST